MHFWEYPLLSFSLLAVGWISGWAVGRYQGARDAWAEQRAWLSEMKKNGKILD